MFEKAYFAENAKLFTLSCYFAPRPEKGTNLGADVLLTADPAPFLLPKFALSTGSPYFAAGAQRELSK